MPFTLNFANLVEYDAGKPGISLTVSLQITNHKTEFSAKLDTGSSDCILHDGMVKRWD
ncbi:MAG: hypothetical protein AB1757_13690 [Acidobacteriota bacterium]